MERVRQGVIVHLRRRKTDQWARGERSGSPTAALDIAQSWRSNAGWRFQALRTGSIFRPVDRHGHVAPGRLTGDAVSVIVKERVAGAGFDPTGCSGHSLRAGFATSAARAGVSSLKIRQQTGHASDGMLARYVRDGELFIGNAAGALL